MVQIKKLNSRGFTHIMILVIVVVLLVVGGAGFLVYKHQHKAHAAGYSLIGNAWNTSAYACQTYSPVYGGVYAVKVILTKASNVPTYPNFIGTIRNKQLALLKGESYINTPFYANTVASRTVHASASLRDAVLVVINGSIFGGGPGSWAKYVDPATLTNC